MPDVGKYETEDDWMEACVPKMVDEGKSQDQAVAACLNQWRNKEEAKESLWQKAKELLEHLMPQSKEESQEEVTSEEQGIHPFMVWKEDSGRYRWLAVYSNKYRDEDNPPEILAEAAHKEFVDAVDRGEWPMPEMWLWHVKGTRSGAADYVAYDNSGFAIASGLVDVEREAIASRLAGRTDLYTSHGMPVAEIRRDEADPSIITRYRSSEISALPRWAAANKHGTGFRILSKEADMAIPEKKRPFLEEVMGEEAVEDLERQLEGKAKELEDQGVEYKESEEVKEDVAEEPVVETPQFVTHDDLVQIFGGYVNPLVEAVQAMTERVEALGKELKEQAEAIKGLQADDEEKLKQAIAQTPAASLFARVGSAIGADETLVDGRTKLAQSKPKEAAADEDGPTLVPFINQLMARQHGG
jgi:hypothetical protein